MRRATLVALGTALVLAVPTAVTVAGSASGEPAVQRQPAPAVELRAGPALKAPIAVGVVPQSSSPQLRAAATSKFKVTYIGFTPTAQAAFQRAVEVWASKLTITVPVTVVARFEPLEAGVLGAAGPGGLVSNYPGAPARNVWYPDAVANQHYGGQLDSSYDIEADFSSSYSNWYFGTAAAPSGTYDFTTVVLHELGHGLGFIGMGDLDGSGLGTVRAPSQSGRPGLPLAFDTLVENNINVRLTTMPDNSTYLGDVLRSGRVYIDSAAIRKANGGRPAKLYAPRTWMPGTSYSHLDESTFATGTADGLMTGMLSPGETIRTPGAITMAILQGVGW